MARDEIANLFLTRGDDELLFWDIDLGVSDPSVMVSMFARLLSHDVDMVAGAYVGHNFKSQWHGAAASTDAKADANGLLAMAQLPLGFSKTKRHVFETVRKNNPWLEYVFLETCMEKPKTGMFEFFPNGIAGPNTGQGKIDRIGKLTKEYKGDDWGQLVRDICKVVDDRDYSQNILLGEDFYFCRLVRESGFQMFTDNNLLVPHKTDVLLPVKNQDILTELSQEWRLANEGNPGEVKALIEKLRPNLAKDML